MAQLIDALEAETPRALLCYWGALQANCPVAPLPAALTESLSMLQASSLDTPCNMLKCGSKAWTVDVVPFVFAKTCTSDGRNNTWRLPSILPSSAAIAISRERAKVAVSPNSALQVAM